MFSLLEIFDMILMTVVLGYIFSDTFNYNKDPYKTGFSSSFSFESLKIPMMVTAPAIILHEMGHKFVALAMGFSSQFHAAYLWLGIGVVLKLVSSPFLFFVPAYVTTSGNMTPLQSAFISVAGPAVNLILWLSAWAYLKFSKAKMSKTKHVVLVLTKTVNMWLFVFNMLPIPFFDGFGFYSGLYHTFI